MEYYFTQEEVDFLSNCTDGIQKLIGRALGRAEAILVRREEFKILQFPTEKTKILAGKNNGDTLTAPEKEDQMLLSINVPGVSITGKPRKDGRFQGYAVRNGNKRYFYGKTREEVMQKIEKYLSEEIKGEKKEKAAKKMPLFGEFTENWIRLYKEPNLKPSSLETLKSSLKYPLARFSMQKMSTITSDDLQKMLLDISGGRIREMCKTNLMQIFKKATAQGIIKNNPCLAIELKAYQYRRRKSLTLDEQNAFLEAIDGSKYFLLYRLALATGIRIGEALALRKSDIDFLACTVTISKNVVFIGGKRIEQATPKTEAGNRTLPVPKWLCEELGKSERDILFPYAANTVQEAMRRLGKKTGIKVTFHILRHTYATRLEEAGIPPKIKQYLLGHASVRMTQDTYTDTQQRYIDSVSDTIRGIFAVKQLDFDT